MKFTTSGWERIEQKLKGRESANVFYRQHFDFFVLGNREMGLLMKEDTRSRKTKNKKSANILEHVPYCWNDSVERRK